MKKILYKILKKLFERPPHAVGCASNDLLGIGTMISGALDAWGNDRSRTETSRQNRADRDFQFKMWNLQNAYNHPLNQMDRLKAGGLNPNLVYGSGNAITPSASMSVIPSRPLPKPNYGEVMGSTISQIADLQMKDAQKDLMAVEAMNKAQQIAKSKSDIAVNNARIPNLNLDWESKKYFDIPIKGEILEAKNRENKMATELYKTTVDGAKAQVTNLQMKNVEQEIRNTKLPEQLQLDLYKGYAQLKTMQSMNQGAQLDNMLKSIQAEMEKKGIQKNDPIWVRLFSEFFPDKKDTKNVLNPKLE